MSWQGIKAAARRKLFRMQTGGTVVVSGEELDFIKKIAKADERRKLITAANPNRSDYTNKYIAYLEGGQK